MPSSRSTLALKLNNSSAFTTTGILKAISAESGGSNTISDSDLRILHIVSARPNIVIAVRALPILKLSPIASGYVRHL